MTTRTKAPFVLSDLPIPPGEILEEELEARGMTRQDLAIRMGADPQIIDAIIGGERAIAPETAVKLASALGIGAHYWLGLEADCRAALAETKRATRRATERNGGIENV